MQEVSMQFVRTIVESSRLGQVIDIPKELRNRKVEVLILPIPDEDRQKKRETLNPDDFEGILHLDVKEIDKEIQNMRDEWKRI